MPGLTSHFPKTTREPSGVSTNSPALNPGVTGTGCAAAAATETPAGIANSPHNRDAKTWDRSIGRAPSVRKQDAGAGTTQWVERRHSSARPTRAATKIRIGRDRDAPPTG